VERGRGPFRVQRSRVPLPSVRTPICVAVGWVRAASRLPSCRRPGVSSTRVVRLTGEKSIIIGVFVFYECASSGTCFPARTPKDYPFDFLTCRQRKTCVACNRRWVRDTSVRTDDNVLILFSKNHSFAQSYAKSLDSSIVFLVQN